tara:strand:+ start:92 stop:319 length:228 start_codon:yes stop_codon:yes gene_type:complete
MTNIRQTIRDHLTAPAVYRGSQVAGLSNFLLGMGGLLTGGDLDTSLELMQWGGLYTLGTGMGELYANQQNNTPTP